MERTKQRTKIKESTGERIFTGVIYAILILFCAIIVFPLLHIVSGSFSDPMALLRGEVSFWPKGFTFSMYEKVFKDASIWQGYGNTIVYTVLGTCISVVLTAVSAFPQGFLRPQSVHGCVRVHDVFHRRHDPHVSHRTAAAPAQYDVGADSANGCQHVQSHHHAHVF